MNDLIFVISFIIIIILMCGMIFHAIRSVYKDYKLRATLSVGDEFLDIKCSDSEMLCQCVLYTISSIDGRYITMKRDCGNVLMVSSGICVLDRYTNDITSNFNKQQVNLYHNNKLGSIPANIIDNIYGK